MPGRSLAIALLIALCPAALHACLCSNGGPRNALRRSSTVFLGRVISTTLRRQEPYGEVRLARFKVTQAIKGTTTGKTEEIEYLVDTGGNCGLPLTAGLQLLVYATPDSGSVVPWTDYCAGTKLQECAEPDLRALRIPVPPGARDCSPPPVRGTGPSRSAHSRSRAAI